jgi:hypothetical protein
MMSTGSKGEGKTAYWMQKSEGQLEPKRAMVTLVIMIFDELLRARNTSK